MNNFFDNQRILQLIWNRKFHFVIIGLLAIILSAIFSGPAFLKPKFRSTARIYPTNLEVFSEESETEQMLEIVNSKDIKLQMFDAFDLDQVYKINKNDPLFMTYMLDKYNKNVGAAKTSFETVEIRVMDHDPQRASMMCDSIIHFYNQKVRRMHKAKAYEMVEILGKEIDKKEKELSEVVDRLNELRDEYGVLDFNLQAERVTEGYVKALAGGTASTRSISEIQKLYDNLARYGTIADNLKQRHLFILKSIDELTTDYDTYLAEYNKIISYAHIVEYPVPADKKSWPVRWIIVAFSTIGAVFFALLLFLILDYKKKQ